ncbi:P-loop containing nucleoside triphosphate hydrolase protein [Xylaria bambusicola]|uniref:P-loop containing nucleoside triphosphate hydrolase protein n=1 Tax=Xylaria bambusicola TaxID=326684 RepID=UPI00200723C8|nr:P-loop containing nucleoside triphosphate hydrolase protein [Xylaria bambusicola]KAI0508319.1 P-loop containing nucleoside triphosphate hydrolase protein [Xylaria bambusicola]
MIPTMDSTMNPGNNKIVFVLGPPGSGKGTVCKEAVKSLKRPPHHHLSVGDYLRELCDPTTIQAGNDIDHNKIRDYLRDNKLLPADVLIPILKDKINSTPNVDVTETTWLIDGFPRNMKTARAFEKTIGMPLKVIVLECSRDVAKHRYLSRAREQMDDEERFDKRYDGYIKNMEAIQKHYKSKGVNMESIPANGDKVKCLGEFMAALPGVSED